jgi:long-chain acyl-CoA synthetase
MTETNAIGTSIGDHDYLERAASSGRCSAVLDLRVVDASGNELPPGVPGELQVRGTSVFRGYWNRPDVDAEVFVEGGWFRTGDVAYLDADGYLFVVDRIKDLIIRGGENIGCGHVEAVLCTHPAVHEAAVYGVPDERLGEEVGATVYADAGLDAEALREFARSHLAPFEVPRYVHVVPAPLPRTASGKIFKRELREQAVASVQTAEARSS